MRHIQKLPVNGSVCSAWIWAVHITWHDTVHVENQTTAGLSLGASHWAHPVLLRLYNRMFLDKLTPSIGLVAEKPEKCQGAHILDKKNSAGLSLDTCVHILEQWSVGSRDVIEELLFFFPSSFEFLTGAFH